MTDTRDPSRVFNGPASEQTKPERPVRIYLWYPAEKTPSPYQTIADYFTVSAGDFEPGAAVPVPVRKGLDSDRLDRLLESRTLSIRDAPMRPGEYPLLVLGQGLYYESPVTHLVLCEYLASHGYIVVSTPLLGTRSRLVSLNVTDLETQIRDMEYAISRITFPGVLTISTIGVIGFDLGGMAGITLAMRNPNIAAFVSLDSGILYEHTSGLPNRHPDYSLDRFRIPWMHITQSRFRQEGAESTAEKRRFGDSIVIFAGTENHGDFTSYAMFGMKNPVPGYWGAVSERADHLYETICRFSLRFLDGALKKSPAAAEEMKSLAAAAREDELISDVVYVTGANPPVSEEDCIHTAITKGVEEAKRLLDAGRTGSPGTNRINEETWTWLGYHFLYWWGREAEAVALFQCIADAFPESSDARVNLGDAYLVNGDTGNAVRQYLTALEINPEQTRARNMLDRLGGKQ